MDHRKHLRVARRAARAARNVLKRYRRQPLDVKTKGEHFNLVTAADLACEDAIVKTIRAAYPDHNILAEEKKYEHTDSPFTWVIDPIDGTSNFAHGFPHYAVSIALAHGSEIVAGVVLIPERGELFQAARGEGATLNGRPIRVSGAAALTQSLILTGFCYDRGAKMERTLEAIGRLLRLGIMDIRRSGSAACDLCYTAAGRVDGYFEIQLNPWDFAAGILIVTEAGGRTSTWEREPLGLAASTLVATNALIHDELVGVLAGERGARRNVKPAAAKRHPTPRNGTQKNRS